MRGVLIQIGQRAADFVRMALRQVSFSGGSRPRCGSRMRKPSRR